MIGKGFLPHWLTDRPERSDRAGDAAEKAGRVDFA
jgi:hypothetical protein